MIRLIGHNLQPFQACSSFCVVGCEKRQRQTASSSHCIELLSSDLIRSLSQFVSALERFVPLLLLILVVTVLAFCHLDNCRISWARLKEALVFFRRSSPDRCSLYFHRPKRQLATLYNYQVKSFYFSTEPAVHFRPVWPYSTAAFAICLYRPWRK